VKLSKEVKVGLLALIAGIILYVGFNYLKGIDFFSPTKKYFVVYQNVEGLTVSNPVTLNGLAVGRVDELRILHDRKSAILVTVEIDDEIKVGDSTIAILANSSLLGGKEIALRLGRNSKEYKKGDTLIGMVDKSLTDIISEKALPVIDVLDSLASKLNMFLDKELGQSVKKTMINFETASTDLRETIAKSKGNITSITSNLSQLTAGLKETERKFRPIIDKMNQVADSLNDMQLKRVVNNANKAMTSLQDIMAKINNSEGSLGLLVNDKQLYRNLTDATQSLDTLLKHFDENPRYFLKPLGTKKKK
jgi:phospholipid/cholesterol/gamma-HCH transport system substrate-binding protein